MTSLLTAPNPEHLRRFDWLNAFISATLNATLTTADVRCTPSLTFAQVNARFAEAVRNRLKNVTVPGAHFTESELRFRFLMEAELWGPDNDDYTTFFAPDKKTLLLQPMKFVDAFFLLERWLHSFDKSDHGRGQFRKGLFGDQGVFAAHFCEAYAALGIPFGLIVSEPHSPRVPGKYNRQWSQFRIQNVEPALAKFYEHATGRAHPREIILQAFHYAQHWLVQRYTKNPNPRVVWYDVIWAFSESVRYSDVLPKDEIQHRPFYWNRDIRWCFSLLTTGLLVLISKSPQRTRLRRTWMNEKRRIEILEDVFQNSRDW